MPLPAGLDGVTVTAKRVYVNGAPASGYIEFAPEPAALSSPAQNVFLGGAVTLTFTGASVDEQSILLLATDSVGVSPTGWSYRVRERWNGAPWRDYSISLPAALPAVNLADVAPVSPSSGTPAAYVVAADALAKTQNLADLPDAGAARTNLGLGSAAVQPATAFDPAGSAAAVTTATAAGFAHAVSLPAPSGTDDTAAINALLAANAGKVVRGRPGSTYRISAPLVVRTGTTLDMTGCTVTLKAGSNCNMLQNYAVGAGGRDSDITVIGGRWDRGANGGTTIALISLFLRGVDRLTLRGITYVSTAGKFAIRVADVTDYTIGDITFPGAASDGVHITGPAVRGIIRNIKGTTGDDLISITPRDWVGYDDVFGDVTDLLVDGVYAKDGTAAVIKLSGGTGCKARRITIRNVYGNVSQWGIAIIDETQNGPCDVDDLTIDGVHLLTSSSGSTIHIAASAAGTIRISNVQDVAGVQNGAVVQVRQNAGSAAASVARLVLDGFDITQGQSRGIVDINTGATVGDLALRNGRFVLATGNGNVITLAGATSVLGRVIAADLHLTSCRCLLNTPASTPAITILARNIHAKSCSRILNLLGVSVDATLSDCVFDSNVSAWVYVSGGTATIRGGGISRVGTQVGVQRAAAEVVRVINPDLPVDLSLLARNADDVAINTNAALACGTGRAISNGTSWKNLYSGAVY